MTNRRVQAHNGGIEALPMLIARNVLPQIAPQAANAKLGRDGDLTSEKLPHADDIRLHILTVWRR
jgi:hypothetical protein